MSAFERVAIISCHPTVNPSVLGISAFFSQQGIAVEHWQGEQDLSPGDGLLMLYRDAEEFAPKVPRGHAERLDQLARDAVANGWTLFNAAMPWTQDKADEYAFYDRIGFEQALLWRRFGPGDPAPEPLESSQYVVKPRIGECGNGVARFDSWEQALRYAEELGSAVIQPYQPGEVVRVLVMPGQVLGSYVKEIVEPGEWIAAVARGAKRRAFELPAATAEKLVKLTEAFEADLIGYDIIVCGEDFWVLEANAAPGLGEGVMAFINKTQLLSVFERALNNPGNRHIDLTRHR